PPAKIRTYAFVGGVMRFVRAGLVLAAAIGLVQSAAAADMPVKAEPVKALPAAAFSWTGFYAGVHAGWGWNDPTGTSSISAAGFPNALTAQHDLGANGPLFGGHAGYNWQIDPRWVIGIEGDITGTGIKTLSPESSTVCSSPNCSFPGSPTPGALMSMSREVNWLASVRGRLGAIWGPGLIYVTGGAAWANVDYKANAGDAVVVCNFNTGCAFPAERNSTKTGFAVGGGYETALGGNWTVRAEYLYYSFGGETLTAAGTPAANCIGGGLSPCTATYTFPDLNIHTVRVGLSYKLGQPAGAPMAGPFMAAFAPRAAASAWSWTGLYAGVHAGWGWSRDTSGTSTTGLSGFPIALIAQHDLGANGPLFGGHLGYNWQIDPRWVIGIEGDITGTGIKALSAQSPFCPSPYCGLPAVASSALVTMSQEVDWLASARGRLGAIWGPGMIYATGGVAWAGIHDAANTGDGNFVCAFNDCAFPATSNATKTGWAAGGGYEMALAGNWTVRAEYLYYSFDGETLTAAATPATSCVAGPCTATYTFPDLKIHTVRLGLSYKF
ncbi:MAG TPA: outer membrane beta-barrel protein, partial [Pseudolabrys sp.]|nr:outer membrane beta-barrel protein [Pseudolabrys sp.]